MKHLLYVEKYTIEGARQKVEEQRKRGAVRSVARDALELETLAGMERELKEILGVLDGRGSP